MPFCGKCGTKVEDGVAFCPECGERMGEVTEKKTVVVVDNPVDKAKAAAAKFNNTKDTTSEYDPQDIANNKFMAVLSYFGPLVFIPLFAAQDSRFAQFHARQGITLFAVDIAYMLLSSLLSLIKIKKTGNLWGVPYEYMATPVIISIILWIISIAICIVAIIGIVNAAKGKAKQLPVIGKYDIWGMITNK